ncbi:MAG: DUF3179 domain-containing protein [Halobacteriaceae archaeon]
MDVRQVLPRDAIPSVDDPAFGREYGGDPGDRAVVVEADPPRAYPLRILHHHEIVNDRVDGDPVAVTWCPLCGSAAVYSRVAGDRCLSFGVSGKLADDDLVMYDRETESEWKQSTGACIAGPLAGARLDALPAAVTTLREFRAAHDGVVLQPPGGASETASADDDPAPIDYGEHPYRAYFEVEGFGLDAHRGGEGREWDRADLDSKDVVVGLVRDGDAVGVPEERVRDAGAVTVTVGGERVVVLATPAGLFAYDHPGFDLDPTGDGRFRGDGAVWAGATGESDDGRRLDRVPARYAFAFAWQDDHGLDAFY